MTVSHFYAKVYQECPKDQRLGQWAFNILKDERSDLAEQIRGGDLDPFYDNGRLDAFMVFVAASWMPERIQLRRTKGWRLPKGAIVVARPSRWGNPFRVGDPHPIFGWKMSADECVRYYRALVDHHRLLMQTMDGSLAGHDLACWCSLSDPCHADVLLEMANEGVVSTAVAPVTVVLSSVPKEDLGAR